MQLPLKTFMINLRKYEDHFLILEILILVLVQKDFILVQLDLEAIGTIQISMIDFNNLIGANANDYKF